MQASPRRLCRSPHKNVVDMQFGRASPAVSRMLVLGGGDVGSAVAHRLFRLGVQVLVSERQRSPHARRGMAFTDALFDGRASLEGVDRAVASPISAGVEAVLAGRRCIPVVDAAGKPAHCSAAFRRARRGDHASRKSPRGPARARALRRSGWVPGYVPGENCHVAIETQWGAAMGQVLHDRSAADAQLAARGRWMA